MAPVQVRHYANLLGRWAAETPNASEIIDGMVRQRVELGLVSHPSPPCSRPVKVRPIVAIQRGVTPTVIGRLRQVQKRLAESGLDSPPLEIYLVNLVGRLDPLEGP